MRPRAWLFSVLALAGLILLVAGLQGTSFREGKPWPSVPSSSLAQPTPKPGDFPTDWFLQLLRFFFFAGLLMLVLSLFFRDLRRHLLRLAFVMGLLFLAWYALQRLPRSELERAPAETAAPSGAPAAEGASEAMEIRPPGWSVYVGALAVGTLLALWLTPKLMARVERLRQARALEEVAREARRELTQGAPVSDVVLRCWLRMVEILSRRSGARDQPHLTPREFAQALANLGFRDEAISLLTQLFEEVRYGHKDSESRRELALSALSALERAYG